MEQKLTAVELIQTIANKLRDKKLKNIASAENDIAVLGEYLGTSPTQTVIFVSLFDRTASSADCNVDDIARYFGCSTLDIVARKNEFDQLLSAGLIENAEKRNERHIVFTRTSFRVPAVVFEAVLANEPIIHSSTVQGELDHFEMIKQVGEWMENRKDENLSWYRQDRVRLSTGQSHRTRCYAGGYLRDENQLVWREPETCQRCIHQI